MGGYWSMGNCVMEIAPASMMMSAMTIAKIGRLMKNLAMLVRRDRRQWGRGGGRGGRRRRGAGGFDGFDCGPGLDLLHARHDDLLAVVQPAFDDPVGAGRAGALDPPPPHLLVCADDERRGLAARVTRY